MQCFKKLIAVVWAFAVFGLICFIGSDFGHSELTTSGFIGGLLYTVMLPPLNIAAYMPIYSLWNA